MARLRAAVSCDIGLGRSSNQDNFYLSSLIRVDSTTYEFRAPEQTLSKDANSPRSCAVYAVFDGMGGTANGGEAARQSALSLACYAGRIRPATCGEQVVRFLKALDRQLFYRSLTERTTIGTTAVMAVLCGDLLHVFNVGDSRAYLYQQGELHQLTVDDTNAQSFKNMQLEIPEARTGAFEHQLTQHLGMPEDDFSIDVHHSAVKLLPGAQFLLCTDGLTGTLSDAYIANTLSERRPSLETVRALKDAAIKHGSGDNITSMLVSFDAD